MYGNSQKQPPVGPLLLNHFRAETTFLAMAELVKRQKVEDGGDPMEVATGGAPSAVQKEDEFSPELLRLYYDRIFPIDLMCRWLSYNSLEHTDASQQLLGLREFSFTTGGYM